LQVEQLRYISPYGLFRVQYNISGCFLFSVPRWEGYWANVSEKICFEQGARKNARGTKKILKTPHPKKGGNEKINKNRTVF